LTKVYVASLTLIVGLTLIYVFQGSIQTSCTFSLNAFPPLISGTVVVVSGLSLERYWRKSKGPFSRVWPYFTAALFLWFLGEAVWAGYTLVLSVEAPYPSVADVFWLSGSIVMLAALCLYVKIFGGVLTR